MSDGRTREIQLTSKQLVFVFMSTLLVAVVVFLLGVWVGRGMGADAASAANRPSGPVAPATSTASTKDAGKLSYPDVLQGGPGASANAPPAARPRVDAPPAPQSPPPASPPPASPPPASPPPATSKDAAKTPPATGPGVTPAAKPPAPSDDPWVVQLGAFSSKANADGMAAELKAKGYPAFVTPGPQFKVRVGPFAQKAAAEQTAARLRKERSKDPKGYDPRVISLR